MPPLPIGARISYGPSLSPATRDIRLTDFTSGKRSSLMWTNKPPRQCICSASKKRFLTLLRSGHAPSQFVEEIEQQVHVGLGLLLALRQLEHGEAFAVRGEVVTLKCAGVEDPVVGPQARLVRGEGCALVAGGH